MASEQWHALFKRRLRTLRRPANRPFASEAPRPSSLVVMSLVSDQEISAFLEAHPAWDREDKEITRTYEFSDFNESMGFVTRIAMEAEKANHHPDIDIRWNKVTLTLSTHDAGGLTAKDLDLADITDGLA